MEKDVTMSSPLGFVPPPPSSGFVPPPPPPPFDYVPPPLYQQPQTNNITINALNFGNEQQHLICPSCHANVLTLIERESNMKTHLFALGLCILGCWCCVPFPYCINNCLVTKHYCPSCRTYLGQCNN